LEIKADGDGLGYNVAALAALPGQNSVGVSFRSSVKIDYTGDATFTPSAVLGPPQAIQSSLTLPPILTVGLANHALEEITLEADVQWVGWSTIRDITIDFVDPALPDAVSTKNWRDSYSFRLGAERSQGPLSLRAGYAYDMTPIPSDTIDPSLADANKHTFAIGGGYRFGKATIDAAYMFIKSNDRGVNTTIATGGTPFIQRGTYSTQVHEVGVGATYRF
jgi:long-chain fatty acid transport protein